MWEVSISTVGAATSDSAITIFNSIIDAGITSGTRISTVTISPGQLIVTFSNYLSPDDITIVNDAITICLVAPPSFTKVKTYNTSKLMIKNTAYTILDKVLFQGNGPLRFRINSYALGATNYSVRFVNATTKEVLVENTFSNTDDTGINVVGVYIGVVSEDLFIMEIQGKVDSTVKASLDGIVIDYN